MSLVAFGIVCSTTHQASPTRGVLRIRFPSRLRLLMWLIFGRQWKLRTLQYLPNMFPKNKAAFDNRNALQQDKCEPLEEDTLINELGMSKAEALIVVVHSISTNNEISTLNIDVLAQLYNELSTPFSVVRNQAADLMVSWSECKTTSSYGLETPCWTLICGTESGSCEFKSFLMIPPNRENGPNIRISKWKLLRMKSCCEGE